MAVRYTSKFLGQLEQILQRANYTLRYEKGQFRSAPCRLHATRVLVINQYLNLEAKIELLLSLIQRQNIDLPKNFRPKIRLKK